MNIIYHLDYYLFYLFLPYPQYQWLTKIYMSYIFTTRILFEITTKPHQSPSTATMECIITTLITTIALNLLQQLLLQLVIKYPVLHNLIHAITPYQQKQLNHYNSHDQHIHVLDLLAHLQ